MPHPLSDDALNARHTTVGRLNSAFERLDINMLDVSLAELTLINPPTGGFDGWDYVTVDMRGTEALAGLDDDAIKKVAGLIEHISSVSFKEGLRQGKLDVQKNIRKALGI